MCLQALYGDVIIFVTVLLPTTSVPIDSSQSDNTDFSKIRVNPTHLRYFEIFNTQSNLIHKNNNNSAIPDTKNGVTNFKRGPFNQMAPKQYEIVNMLWKKRKEYNKVDTSTSNYRPIYYPLFKSPFVINQPFNSAAPTSTPSFFEFYYLDENYDGANKSKRPEMQKIKNIDVFKTNNADYQIFAFHINEPFVPPNSPNSFIRTYGRKDKTLSTISPVPVVSNSNPGPIKKVYLRMPYKRTPRPSLYTTVISSTANTKVPSLSFISLNEETKRNKVLNNAPTTNTYTTGAYRNWIKSTTINDRIKFFEMYDKLTPLPNFDLRGNLINLEYIEKLKNSANDQVIISEHATTNNAAFISNRATTENNTKDLKDYSFERKSLKPVEKNNNNSPLKDLSYEVQIKPHNKLNKLAVWSENSFMAVYIYEPSQVRCDAAGISSHWLVTSGSCLSRHHRNPGGEGRSAFVAYCGTTWWNAERIAYVKYSVVHPNYHQRDAARKYMYNIGLVQVVNAMTTCPGWSPISLISHQFTTDPTGSTAYSVGWGLDRYNVLYPSSSLPRNPLLIYENKVFSDACPGSLGYTQVKQESGDDAVKNVYCLSLPPYAGEAADPIHGSMLIVEGKLCAIFLQEERRTSGQQCAEYTGTWRLNSWVNRVAREMDYPDQFPFEI